MKAIVISLFLGGLIFSNVAYTDDKATAIIRHGERVLRGKSTQALMTMTIKRPDYTRELQLRSWTVGNQRALVEILSPKKEQGVSSLRVESNMWNYLPKVDQVVRVPTSLMLQSWMGSDFTNDDLMKSSSLARDYTHTIVGVETVGGEKTRRILCRPKPNAPVVWGQVMYWARASDNLPVKQMFYDESGKWVRTIAFSRFRKMDDRVIPTQVVVTTAEEPRNSTVVSYQKILYDRQIDDGIFSKSHLRKNAQRGRTITAGWSLAPMRAGRN